MHHVCLSLSLLGGLACTSLAAFIPVNSVAYIAKYDDLNKNYRFEGADNKASSSGANSGKPYKDLSYTNFSPASPPQLPFTPFSGKVAILSPVVSSSKIPTVAISKTLKQPASFDLQEVYFGCASMKNGTANVGFCMLHITGSKPGAKDVTQDCAYEAWGNTMINCVFTNSAWKGLQKVTFTPIWSDPNTVIAIDNLKYVVHKRT